MKMALDCVYVVDTEGMPKEDWLEHRNKGIGGSDIGAICGLNPYKSALGVYLDKVGAIETFTGNIATEVGTELEPYLRRKFVEWMKENKMMDIEVVRETHLLRHSEHPWMLANLDGIFFHPQYGYCVLELKTAGEFSKEKFEDDEIPDSYYLQIQHYLAVTGLEMAFIAYLIGNRLFNVKEVPRNEAVIESIIKTGESFWQDNVLANVAPAPDGSADAGKIIKLMYPTESPEASPIDLSDMTDEYIEYKSLSEQLKSLELKKEEIKQRFAMRLGSAPMGMVQGKKITYKTVNIGEKISKPYSFRAIRIY